MELKDFVSGTIKQIIDGVNDAIEYGKQHNAMVNPDSLISFGDRSKFGFFFDCRFNYQVQL